MSLTEAEQIFAGVHESGLNDFITAFFSARPRFLNYASPPFISTTTSSVTSVSAIPFPGVPGGIPYAVTFSIPRIDLHPDSSGGASPLPIAVGQFTVRTSVRLIIGCGRRSRDPDNQTTAPIPGVSFVPIATGLEVWAVGRPTVSLSGDGTGELGIAVEAVEIVDISPNSLESVLECLILTLLQSVLANVRLPIRALRAGAFSLTLTRGPETEDNQEKLYGSV